MIYSQDPQYQLYHGDIRDLLKEIPEHSVDVIVTSPPYYGLRAYKAPDSIWDGAPECQHEWGSKASARRRRSEGDIVDTQSKEATKLASAFQATGGNFCLHCGAWKGVLGSEPTVQLYIKHLCDIFDQCRRVLKPTGSLWVNLDDSHAGSGCGTNDYRTLESRSINKSDVMFNKKPPQQKIDIPAKSLCAVPERFVVEMTDRGWIHRNTVIWQKLSCMPESVKDRFTIDWEPIFFFTMQQKYFFERQFEPISEVSLARAGRGWHGNTDRDYPSGCQSHIGGVFNKTPDEIEAMRQQGRNKRCVWTINPEPQKPVTKGAVAHYAAFPTKLCTTPILATVPEQICTKCGIPRVKVYEDTGRKITQGGYGSRTAEMLGCSPTSSLLTKSVDEVKEVGLSDCGCQAPFRPGVCLDPFGGTGTVAVEARNLGRKAILVEISEQYCELAKKRLESIPLPMGF